MNPETPQKHDSPQGLEPFTEAISSARNVRHDDSSTLQTVEAITAANVKTIADLERVTQENCSRADRVAVSITAFCGSLAFVWVHVIWFVVWIVANTILLTTPIDPYPFSLLALVVSLEAIFLSTFIMISGNRQGRLNERRNHLDLQINLLAEQENTRMLVLLEDIARKLQINPDGDPGAVALKQATRPEVLLQQIDGKGG